MLSRWLPCWLKMKCCSLALGMMKWSCSSSPSMEEQKVKAWKVHSESCKTHTHTHTEFFVNDGATALNLAPTHADKAETFQKYLDKLPAFFKLCMNDKHWVPN